MQKRMGIWMMMLVLSAGGCSFAGASPAAETEAKEMRMEEVQTEEVQTEEVQTEEVQTKETQTEEARTEEAQTGEAVGGKETPPEEVSADAAAEEIGLALSVKNVSATGATLVFVQYDGKAPAGTLQYGEAYALEVQRDGKWEEVPVTAEGEYGFHDIAYILEAEAETEQEINWEWLYGSLSPGTYRIRKTVDDCTGSSPADTYTVYAEFIWNG